jgi:LysM repeat protein
MRRMTTWAILAVMLLAGCNLAQPGGQTPEAALTPQTVLTCDQLIGNALQTVGNACKSTGRNQACYGNRSVQAEFQSGQTPTFTKSGDLADLFAVRRLETSALDETAQTWGIALLKAQGTFPDTLPGQNITFLLFGDTSMDGINPQANAVVLRTGIGSPKCAAAPASAALIQSPEGANVTLKLNGASVTLGSTLYVTAAQNNELEIATIEGQAVVSAFNATRVVLPGASVGLPLGGSDGLQVVGPPSDPRPFDQAEISRAPLSLLDRQVSVPPPVAPSTATPPLNSLATSTPPLSILATSTIPATFSPALPATSSVACVPRADWTATYTIQRGDTLFGIAQRFNLTLVQLQQGNCITNANLIQAGQTLRVPFQLPTQPPPATSAPIPTDTPVVTLPPPPVVRFTADKTLLQAGDCTPLRWTVSNAKAVQLMKEQVDFQGATRVCPKQTTTYTLLVTALEGTQTPYPVTVEVALPFDSTPTDVVPQ